MPDTPCEQGYIHFYSSVLQAGPGDYRMYYFSKGLLGELSHVAVAMTPRGPWRKPSLALFNVSGSTDNNVIWEGILVSVFIDKGPNVSANQRYVVHDTSDYQIDCYLPLTSNLDRPLPVVSPFHNLMLPLPRSPIRLLLWVVYLCSFKAVISNTVLSSHDGFVWKPESTAFHIGWTHFADTQPVVFWDPATEIYVASGRIDGVSNSSRSCVARPFATATPGVGAGRYRRVGIAMQTNLVAGAFGDKNVSVALGFQPPNRPCEDLYTSQTVRYENLLLMFPSLYSHFRSSDPPTAPNGSSGKGNDGVLDIRLAAARSGKPFAFVEHGTSSNTTDTSWMPRGQGTFLPPSWRFVGDFDAGHVFMTRGLLTGTTSSLPNTAPGDDWDTIIGYHHGSQLTHGGVDKWFAPGYHNDSEHPLLSGIRRWELRRDGFVSMRVNALSAGGIASTAVSLPSCAAGLSLRMLVNADVSVGASIHVGIGPDTGAFGLPRADPVTGNGVRLVVSWSGCVSLSPLQGQRKVPLRIELSSGARLYAYEFSCQ